MNTRQWLKFKRVEEREIIRQRISVAFINMAVLAVIWTVLAGFVYSMDQRQYLQAVDHQLENLAWHMSRSCPHCQKAVVAEMEHEPLTQVPDVHLLLWDSSNPPHVVASYHPFPQTSKSEIQSLLDAHLSSHPVYYSVRILNVSYRVMQWPIRPGLTGQVFENIQDDESRLARLLTLLVWGGALGLILSVLGGFLMGLWTLRPILAVRRREQEFLSDVSHELRTPLFAMTAHVELLLSHSHDRIEEHLPWIEALYSETQRMANLVKDLLEIGHLEEGAGSLNLSTVSLQEICEEVFAIYQPVCELSGLNLALDIADDALVRADPQRLRQLLLIFLDNAHKYTHQGGCTIRIRVRKHHAEIHLEDTGSGMSAAVLPKATRRFVRGDEGEGVSPKGSGLGLAIAQKIVQAHRAKLILSSVPGQGTHVTVIFRRIHREHGISPRKS
ncbi:His Kinase A (phospho-acceptor) domain-containing protein [Sulfobacillus thermosulfidooxidans DSM 9293]|uniref:histidine kinase n=1 Tax=Sulfobacillus thermosulfidooxidans (strain DSM 9293 / VKM B-1269 / AT-1) TaxID=929705 RepID=A0A1W1WB17_SULTA|nr:HAMP domain-containing sensor histidine kinase [Sulfobacillus thermosulfidooxidans]SMC03392.1 His Kinase A (phospho-acceptor) domain-containing protein [Sulfobacillus thermosulfidooxidans DSM 9293]